MESLQQKLDGVADQISAYQRIKKLSQRELADILEVQVSYLNRVLKANANLTLRTVSDFEAKMGISLLTLPRKVQ